MEEPQPLPHILSPCSSGRRRSCDTNSPEFEFWMVRNPSFPQPNLLSADELFSDGLLLPLHLLHLSNELSPSPPPPEQELEASGQDQNPEPEPSPVELGDLSSTTTLTNSKRWRYIFKKSGKKTLDSSSDDHIKKKDVSVKDKVKRDKKSGGAVGVSASSNVLSAAELNINIWPFSRSRSAGNGGTRPRSSSATRKVSSAPCSRSNSTGESKYRKWPNSPSRAGVHLGRSSPVWQARRAGGGSGRSSEAFVKNAEKGVKKDGNEGRRKIPAAPSGGGGTKARALSLNVPMCIGYRHNLSCRSEENSTLSVAAAASAGGGGSGDGQIVGCISSEGVRRSNLFNIKNLFTKKVH